jgi:hypothetical protein
MRGLSEASYEMTEGAFNRGQSDKADEKLLVQFSLYPHPNKEKTAAEGRPVFDEKEYVMIMVPGDKESIVHRPAWEKDRQRFPRQYQAFRNKQDQAAVSGTPLRSVGFVTLGQIKELEYFNCYTVEQLANISDAHAGKFMGIQKLKQLANDYLTAAKETAPLTAMRAEMDKKDAQIASNEEALKDQARRIKALEELITKTAEDTVRSTKVK